MIYGSYCLLQSQNNSLITSHFEKLKEWNFCKINNIDAGNFDGGFIINPELPYLPQDFYFQEPTIDLIVLLSGCIYNRAELVTKYNLKFGTTDPELIANLFNEHGAAFCDEINGDFAIVIVQKAAEKIWIFRDHLGIRPLAYSISDRSISFSTDIIGLCGFFKNNEPINSTFLAGQYKIDDYTKTPDKHVSKLLPGHYLEFGDGINRLTKYWHPERIRTDNNLNYDVFLNEIKAVLFDSVRIRVDPRFISGAHVSGGLDSSIVAAIARKACDHQKEFYGFSWSPEEYDEKNVVFDERELVRSACKLTRITPVFSTIKTHEFIAGIYNFIYNQGFYHEDILIQQAIETKTNLIFSGYGGDEFISKTDIGIDSDLFFGLRWKTFFRKNKIKYPKQLIKIILLEVLLPALGLISFQLKRIQQNEYFFLKKAYRRINRDAFKHFYFYKSRRDNHLGYLKYYHLQNRIEPWAINGYMHGIEYRYPLLDKRIVEYMLKVPSEHLCKSTHFREVLRLISEGILPEEVRWKKQGTDPVLFEQRDHFFKEVAIQFMNEVNEWEANSDLYIIDFIRLKKRIEAYKTGLNQVDDFDLFYFVARTKAIHEFSKSYRSNFDIN